MLVYRHVLLHPDFTWILGSKSGSLGLCVTGTFTACPCKEDHILFLRLAVPTVAVVVGNSATVAFIVKTLLSLLF